MLCIAGILTFVEIAERLSDIKVYALTVGLIMSKSFHEKIILLFIMR